MPGQLTDTTYLEDTTGGRRFWPILCHGSIAVDAIAADRDQLWAEAYQLYQAKTPWHLPREITEPEQAKRQPEELWEGLIKNWLAPGKLYYKDNLGEQQWVNKSDGVLMAHIAVGALGLTATQMHGKNYTRCRDILEAMGWTMDGGRWFEPVVETGRD